MSTGYLQVTMYMGKIFHLQLASVIVGKFAGWLMYLPALPNCMLTFHSSTGGSSATSLMILSFQPDFQYEGDVHHAQYGQFYIQVFNSGPILLAAYF